MWCHVPGPNSPTSKRSVCVASKRCRTLLAARSAPSEARCCAAARSGGGVVQALRGVALLRRH
eukprot:5723396-Alexandrium_andersonii.AAC.1